ncbi:MAG: glycosyltransferase [Burkholderiales bacterium]
MIRLPTLLLYCQHSLGMGHLTRSFAIAAALSKDFRVVFLNGGPLPANSRIPHAVEIENLPPLGMEDGHHLVSRGELQLAHAKQRRRQAITEIFRNLQPDVLLIELFPFGRKKFAFELLPLLKAARQRTKGTALVICSLRDILVGTRPDQQHHDERARWITDRYFDAVLVHADPRFAKLGETFQPAKPLKTPVRYTGFVVPEKIPTPLPARGTHVLVSAGGGAAGHALFAAAIHAQATLWKQYRIPMRLIAGPLLPEPQWQRLRELATGREGMELVRSVPDMAAEFQSAGLSLSQCGYNTALEIVQSGVRALVVPYAEGREDEQMNRARRLETLGVIRILDPAGISAARLAAEMSMTTNGPSPQLALDMSGAANTSRILKQMLGAESCEITSSEWAVSA